jgi:hypothetical protein
MNAEASAMCGLGIVLVLAWIVRKDNLEWPNSLLALGAVVCVAGNALCGILWSVYPDAKYLYPVPALAALLLWNACGMKPKYRSLESYWLGAVFHTLRAKS